MENGMLFLFGMVAFVFFWKSASGGRSSPVGMQLTSRASQFRERRSGYSRGTPFYAVSIHAEPQCCVEVSAIEAQRFLSDDAPGLPLPLCDQAVCRCTYQHHGDRRSGARDRRYSEQLATDTARFWSLKNRRNRPGRRSGDVQLA
ncbi:MAG: hypothetical protein AB8C02_10765 [Halioglobus sp.]